jgi:hypothetical protein
VGQDPFGYGGAEAGIDSVETVQTGSELIFTYPPSARDERRCAAERFYSRRTRNRDETGEVERPR